MAFENESIKELLSLLEGVAPTVTAELRDRLQEAEREIYSDGYSAGLDEGVLRASVPDEETFLRGQARGMAWAYHAAKGHQVEIPANPYAREAVVNGLLNMNAK
jgi:hypothetical protein